ncbi:MAG: class GN sortase [Lysobacterales bacterium]|jgi:sortase A
MMQTRHWLYTAVVLTAVFFSGCLALQAAWIPAKAALAQWLIERSWQQVLAGGPPGPPWPWADTTPLAELTVPRLGIRLIVLKGNSGRNLAFGPVFADGSATGNDVVISGHRDTHFRFLKDLRPGDRVRLRRRGGSAWFAVRDSEVVDSRERELVLEPSVERLSLVTCYPFNSPTAGGPLRYVVNALPVTRRSPSSG